MDYKSTLNLPKTSFPMRGNLPVKEKQILQFWEEIDLYGKLTQLRPGKTEVYAARRPSLREREYPPRHRSQQDTEGYYR